MMPASEIHNSQGMSVAVASGSIGRLNRAKP